MHDPVSEILTGIRNASKALLPSLTINHSRLKESIARTLQAEGYVTSVEVVGEKIKSLKITLKYFERNSVITRLTQVSTPGLRRYVRAAAIPRVLGGMGVAIVSTPSGVMTGTQAFKSKQGGELLCLVW